MIRAFIGRVGLGTLLLSSPAVGYAQVDDLCDLLDAEIVADDGQFIGRITPDPEAFDSLLNPFGDYGSEFSRLSIFNPFGPYGGMFSLLSPFNPITFFPPRIIRDAQTLARLTLNESFSPRVDPDEMVAWLRSGEADLCFQPTPTPTPSHRPPSTPLATATASPSASASPSNGTPTATRTMAPATASPTASTPRPTRTPSPPVTPSDPTAPPAGHDDEGCAVVAPEATSTFALLLSPFAALQFLRRRRMTKRMNEESDPLEVQSSRLVG